MQLGLFEHFTLFCVCISLPAYPTAPNIPPSSTRKQQRDLQDPIQMLAVTCPFSALYTNPLKAYVPQVPTTLKFIFRPILPILKYNGLGLWGSPCHKASSIHPFTENW